MTRMTFTQVRFIHIEHLGLKKKLHKIISFQIWLFLGNLAVSYAVAFVTSLTFEAPMMGLEKIVFPRN